MNRRSSTITALVSLAVFILIEAVSILLIYHNGTIQRYKLMVAVRSVQSFFWDKGESSRYFISLKGTNEALVEENIRLVKELEKYKSYWSKEISDSLIRDFNPDFTYIPATVLKNTTNRQHNYIVINKGSNDGIKPDMGVVTPSGVVGYVQSVSKKHSLVVSFLDIDYTITAIIKKWGTFGTFHWGGKRINEAILSEIPIHSSFSVGDTITTSGYSAIYPKGINLGTIKSQELIGGTSYNLTISLFEDFSNLHHVYVVDNPNNIEFKKLIEKGDSLQ